MDDNEEMCPICRSSKYLNPDMRFLVNPECYHKMCESCVDRIFSGGPAPCPFRGCGKTLRKSRFKRQVFDDLEVEREVDVRQRVVKAFNSKEDSFASEREYNDYLERIETIVFSIAYGASEEKEEALQELAEYEQLHRKEILDNAIRQREEEKRQEEVAALEVERQRRMRLLAIEMKQQEQDYAAILEQETLQSLASGADSEQVLRQQSERAKQQTEELQKKYEAELQRHRLAQPTAKTRTNGRHTPLTPWTPFAGDRQVPELYTMRDYYDPLIDKVNDPSLRAGGFSVAAAQREALTLAFMSLDIDIQEEKADKDPLEIHSASKQIRAA